MQRAVAVLEHFGARPSDGAATGVTLDLGFAVGAPLHAPDLPVTARHLDVEIRRDDDGLWLGAPGTTARVDADGSAASVVSHHGDAVPLHVFTCVLFHQLRLLGAFALHAAVVAREGRGCLIVGPSGAGKSTLTLALARLGWQLVSDDSVLLVRAPDRSGLRVLAMRRGIYLAPGSQPLPAGGRWQPCPLVEAVKEELVLDRVTRADRALPALILLPELVDADHTTFEPVDAAEACWALLVESRLSELDRYGASEHLAVLCALAGSVPAVRARLGRDVRAAATGERCPEGEAISRLLEAHLAGSGPADGRAEVGAVQGASSSEGSWDRRPTEPSCAALDPAVLHEPVYAPLPGVGGVLLHPRSLEAFALDRLGAQIWELACAGPVDAVAPTLADELGLEVEVLRPEVDALLQALAGDGLVPTGRRT